MFTAAAAGAVAAPPMRVAAGESADQAAAEHSAENPRNTGSAHRSSWAP
jgi:hypothetical protein